MSWKARTWSFSITFLHGISPRKIAQKAGEEAVELVIEAVRGKRERIIEESADLMYHLLVLWADAHVRPADVLEELVRREGISGLAEKAARTED